MYNINVQFIYKMKTIAVSNFRSQLPKYLQYVTKGEQIILTLHNKEIARIIPADSTSKNAKEKLRKIGKNSKMGDLTSPIDTLWKLQK